MLAPLELAREVIARSNRQGISVSNLALQKLAYFAHGWFLALIDHPLLDEKYNFEAWRFGPVEPSIYHAFKVFSSNPIPLSYSQSMAPGAIDDSSVEAAVIDKVLQVYGNYPANKLVEFSHDPNSPWYSIYYNQGSNSTIPNSDIKDYFRSIKK